MSVSVRSTPSTFEIPPGITFERSSCSLTRTIATRSNSPATDETSETPSMSAIAWAASEISSISHWISTTAWTVISSGPFEDDGEPLPPRDAEGWAFFACAPSEAAAAPLPAGDAECREAERGAAFAHLIREGQQDPRAAHPD